MLASKGTLSDISRAVQIDPSDGALLGLAAEYRSNAGDASPEVDRDLERAAQLNPLDSSIPITLGLRAEFRGDNAAAERWLLHAAQIDRQFRPAWTLANFYLRSNVPEKIWPLIRRCLSLDPLGYDPDPVFSLCWNASNDSGKILGQMPRSRPRLLQYLAYLMRRDKPEAALELWPEALAVMDPANSGDAATVTGFPGFLVEADRVGDAVGAWNELVRRNIVHSGSLDAAAGRSIADTDFAWPRGNGAFGWNPENIPGVFFSDTFPSLRVDFDGNEPETFRLLSIIAPVVPARKYRLTWESDSSRLNTPNDPGLAFQCVSGPSGAVAPCAPLLQTGRTGGCDFANPASQEKARIELIYRRAPGTTRIQGSLKLIKVSLGFGS